MPSGFHHTIDCLEKHFPQIVFFQQITDFQKCCCIQNLFLHKVDIHEFPERPLLADEPTGALDSRATDELLRVFSDISASGQTILMVTHSVRAASRAGRVLFIKDGEVCHQLYRGGMTDDQLYQKITDALTVLQAGGERV